MRMSEKCRNNNSDNPLTSRRTLLGKREGQSGATRYVRIEVPRLNKRGQSKFVVSNGSKER